MNGDCELWQRHWIGDFPEGEPEEEDEEEEEE